MTELQAVNSVRRALGVSQTSLLDDGDEDTILARAYCDAAKAAVLGSGWYFNEYTAPLAANSEGLVTIPADVLTAIPTDRTYRQRGSKLFDTVNLTFNIGQAVETRLIYNYAWDELPHSAANACSAFARYQAFSEMDRDEKTTAKLKAEYDMARSLLMTEHITAVEANSFNSPRISQFLGRVRPGSGYHS